MAELYDLKNRIDGLKKIESMTYSMQIITISRLKRLMQKNTRIEGCLDGATKALSFAVREDGPPQGWGQTKNTSLFKEMVILFCSNRGFCGLFNQEILGSALTYLSETGLATDQVQILGVGKKSAELGLKKRFENVRYFSPEKDTFNTNDMESLLKIVLEAIQSGLKIRVIYYGFKSILSNAVRSEDLSPIPWGDFLKSETPQVPTYLEPDVRELTADLTIQYLYLKLLHMAFETSCSEFSQRFLIMKGAVDNVKELVEDLTLDLNKERQRMITQELSEIISSSKALKLSRR